MKNLKEIIEKVYNKLVNDESMCTFGHEGKMLIGYYETISTKSREERNDIINSLANGILDGSNTHSEVYSHLFFKFENDTKLHIYLEQHWTVIDKKFNWDLTQLWYVNSFYKCTREAKYTINVRYKDYDERFTLSKDDLVNYIKLCQHVDEIEKIRNTNISNTSKKLLEDILK